MTEHEINWKSQAYEQVEALQDLVTMAAVNHEVNQYIATEILQQIKEIKDSLLKF